MRSQTYCSEEKSTIASTLPKCYYCRSNSNARFMFERQRRNSPRVVLRMSIQILVVDTDAADRLIITKILGSQFQVEVATSANEALAKAGIHTFQLVIINTKLVNHGDGIVLLKELRRVQSEFVAIATMALLHEPEVSSLMMHGFRVAIEKPVTRVDLPRLIRQVMAPCFRQSTTQLPGRKQKRSSPAHQVSNSRKTQSLKL